jgi:hypothetical protein
VEFNSVSPLSKSAILSAPDLQPVAIDVPEWGGRIYIRPMTGAERDRWEIDHLGNPGVDVRARLAVSILCDESGKLLFGREDIPDLTQKSAHALDRIWSAGTKLCRITNEDVEALRKNSETILSGVSPSV